MEINYFESQPYFSRKNLELILGKNRRTLDARIKSLIDKGILLRLKKGFYLSIPYYNNTSDETALLEYIGSILVYPSYIYHQMYYFYDVIFHKIPLVNIM